MKASKLIVLLLSLSLVLALSACGGSSTSASTASAEPASSDEGITVGGLWALTGFMADYEIPGSEGFELALEEINANGGILGRPVEVVRGDHAGDVATGKSEAERLITQEHVDVMLGCHMSVVTEVVAQVCQQYNVPMITAISTLDRLSDEDHKDMDCFFRLCPLNSVYVRDMLQYLKDSQEQTGQEIKNIAIFTDRAAIGQELIRCVELYAPEFGFNLVDEVDYSSNATDLNAQVLKLKSDDPDAILCDSYIGDATLFIQTLKEQNYKPKMIVAKANGYTDPSFLENLGKAADGVASVVEFNPDMTNGAEINEEFKKEYGVDMNGHSAESYTAVWCFKQAIEAAGSTDGDAVKQALADLDVKGSFDGGRDIILPYNEINFEDYDLDGAPHYRDNTSASVAIAQVQDGTWKTVWPFDYTDNKIQYPVTLE